MNFIHQAFGTIGAFLLLTSPGLTQEGAFSRPALPFPDNLAAIAASGLETEFSMEAAPGGNSASQFLLDADIQGASVSLAHKAFIESICGFDDSQDVELYNGALGPSIDFVDQHQPSTMQIQWNSNLAEKYSGPNAEPGNVSGARWCTATLLADNIAITASHCFDQTGGGWIRPRQIRDGAWQVISSQEIATNMHANFNYQRARDTFHIRTPLVFPIIELIEYHSDLDRTDAMDFAFIRLGANSDGEMPGDLYPYLELGRQDVAVGTQITMLQHPAGQPKKVEAGNADKFEGDLLHYGDLDTQGGSSGSGVLNDQGQIIGVHIQGGCTQFAGSNKAVPISSVWQSSSFVNGQQ